MNLRDILYNRIYPIYYNEYLIEMFRGDILDEKETNDIAAINIVKELLQKNKLKTTAKEFHASMGKSKHKEMLTPYSVSELSKMKLFKVPGYDIGYALKKWKDGTYSEIVAVHNNSGIKGIGKILMASAIDNGGCYLDHFDGFLTQLYSSMGFVEYDRDKFDPQYFEGDTFQKKYGKADVIYRVHKKCQGKLKKLMK